MPDPTTPPEDASGGRVGKKAAAGEGKKSRVPKRSGSGEANREGVARGPGSEATTPEVGADSQAYRELRHPWVVSLLRRVNKRIDDMFRDKTRSQLVDLLRGECCFTHAPHDRYRYRLIQGKLTAFRHENCGEVDCSVAWTEDVLSGLLKMVEALDSIHARHELLDVEQAVGKSSRIYQSIDWERGLQLLVALKLSHLTVANLVAVDHVHLRTGPASVYRSSGEWQPAWGLEGKNDYGLRIRSAHERDTGRHGYLIFGSAPSLSMMEAESSAAYTSWAHSLNRAAATDPNPPTTDDVVAGYELLRAWLRGQRRQFQHGQLPRVKNYLPASSYAELCRPGESRFGPPAARAAQLDLLAEMSSLPGEPDAYRLLLLDDFTFNCSVSATELRGVETLMLVGRSLPNGAPLGDGRVASDFDCGGLYSVRGYDFAIGWSTAREKCEHAMRLFDALDGMHPTTVSAGELRRAAAALRV